jgi:hypothetical protein
MEWLRSNALNLTIRFFVNAAGFLTGCTSERSDARDWICGHPSELYT